AQYNKLDSLQNACDLVSSEVMGAKVLGSIPLAILSIDEAYAQIFEKPGFLGSKPNLNSAHRNTGEVILSESFIGQMLESDSTIVPNPPNNVDFKIKLGAVLRASEVGFAAISNIALFYEGRGGTIYTTTSVLSNVFKFCRIAYNQSVGI
ncbi:MAG: hypothetical protein JSS09_07660, partial [Verrucomicrobia bacterium]|nr:hypothetical protein [Verrucomicrobiota bacterium]